MTLSKDRISPPKAAAEFSFSSLPEITKNNKIQQKSPEPVTVKQMQSTTGGATGSRSGGGGSGGGLARFRSAPAAWLEALLEDEEEDLLRPNQCLTQLLAGNSSDLDSPADQALFETNPSAGFQRQNSSSAEFLGASGIGEGFYSSYAINSSAALEISPTSKRGREVDAQNFPPKFSPQLVIILFRTSVLRFPVLRI